MNVILTEFGHVFEGGPEPVPHEEWLDITKITDADRVLYCWQTGETRRVPFNVGAWPHQP